MEKTEIMKYVDHTVLRPTATWAEIRKLCEEAAEYKAASVCIPACYIKRVKETFGDTVRLCTVVGFPLGYSSTEGKLAETAQALKDGADEIDMVINICDVKNGEYGLVESEIRALKKMTGDKILKVIVEACYLTEEEKIAMCQAVTAAGADYIKTSTGFGTSGAALADVRLFKEKIGPGVKIKAAGGIKSLAEMKEFIAAGAERIGTSSAVNWL